MRTPPFRFSVTSDELVKFPQAVGHCTMQRSAVNLPETSLRLIMQASYAALESVSDPSNQVEVELHELEDMLMDTADMA